MRWAGLKGGVTRRRRLAAIVGCALLSAAILPTASLAASAPAIGAVSADVSENTATLEARIRPDGLETTYAFWLKQPACGSSEGEATCESFVFERVAEGHIAADRLEEPVSANLSGLRWNYAYTFQVTATNLDGESARDGFFTTGSAPPPGAPEGTGAGPPYESPEEPWNEEGAKKAAEEAPRLEAEREAARRAEAKSRAGTPADGPRPASTTACSVPSLVGRSLASAHTALSRRHCSLGAVAKPMHRHGPHGLIVIWQSRRLGAKLPVGALVAVRLGTREKLRSKSDHNSK